MNGPVRLSVHPSVRPSVCHTFLTMFPSSYHHEIFRSCYQWQMWRPCKSSRSKVMVTEVTTQLNRFRTVTPVWIHIFLVEGAFFWLRAHALRAIHVNILAPELSLFWVVNWLPNSDRTLWSFYEGLVDVIPPGLCIYFISIVFYCILYFLGLWWMGGKCSHPCPLSTLCHRQRCDKQSRVICKLLLG